MIRPNKIDMRERMYAIPVSECFPENYVQLCPRFVITLYPEVEYNITVILASTEYVNEQERLIFDRMQNFLHAAAGGLNIQITYLDKINHASKDFALRKDR